MADIDKLLNKKGWTGRELGIIEISSMCHQVSQKMQGNPNPEPLVTEGKLRKMLNTLTDTNQCNIYNDYIAVHQWLSLYFNVREANFQQAQLQFNTISGILLQAMQSEDIFSYIASLPLIMTRQQFEEEKAKGRALWFTTLDGEPRSEDLISIVYRAFNYYAKMLDESPSKPNPLKPIRKKYLDAPITSPIIKARYNEVMKHGYYILDDGRRSDQMPEEEWQQIISEEETQNAIKAAVANGEAGGPEARAFTWDEIMDSDYFQQAESLYRTGDKFATAKELARKRKEAAPEIAFCVYDDLPADLNKWDFLIEDLIAKEVYGTIFEYCAETDDEYAADLADFLKEFEDMVAAMLKDIADRAYKGKPDPAELPISKWASEKILCADMYDMDLYGFREETDTVDILFDGNHRAIFNGIAILEPPGAFGTNNMVDEYGRYIPPQIHQTFARTSLEAYFPTDEEYAENVDELESARTALLNSYYFLKAYNIALDLIANRYDLPCVDCFRVNVERIEERLESLNSLIPVLYLKITQTAYEDEELKNKKLQALQDVFTPIDYKGIAVPQEEINRVKTILEANLAFRDGGIPDDFFHRKLSAEEVSVDE